MNFSSLVFRPEVADHDALNGVDLVSVDVIGVVSSASEGGTRRENEVEAKRPLMMVEDPVLNALRRLMATSSHDDGDSVIMFCCCLGIKEILLLGLF